MTDGEDHNPHGDAVRKLANAMLRTALLPASATVGVCVALAAVFAGTAGLYGALIGGAVVFGSSLLTIVMMKQSADLPVTMVMAVALGGFAFKLMALLVVIIALKGVDALHPMSLALTMLATIIVWAGAELVAFKRTKIPTLVISDAS